MSSLLQFNPIQSSSTQSQSNLVSDQCHCLIQPSPTLPGLNLVMSNTTQSNLTPMCSENICVHLQQHSVNFLSACFRVLFSSHTVKRLFQKYKKPKFIQCFTFSLTGDVLTGDSEGNILTWGKSAADVKTLGKGAKGQTQDAFCPNKKLPLSVCCCLSGSQ